MMRRHPAIRLREGWYNTFMSTGEISLDGVDAEFGDPRVRFELAAGVR